MTERGRSRGRYARAIVLRESPADYGVLPDYPTKSKLASFLDCIVEGDCREVLRKLPQESVDLIVTSPPYTDRRERVCGRSKPDDSFYGRF